MSGTGKGKIGMQKTQETKENINNQETIIANNVDILLNMTPTMTKDQETGIMTNKMLTLFTSKTDIIKGLILVIIRVINKAQIVENILLIIIMIKFLPQLME